MRGLGRGIVAALLAAGIVASPGALRAQEGPEPGRGHPAGEWPLVGGNWSSSRYSNLDDISLDTVDRLGGAWVTPLPGGAASRATPVMRDGVLYLTAGANVFAIDARTGETVWRWQPIPVKPITRSGGKPITCSGANRSPVPTQTDHLSERSDAGRNHESRFSVRVDGRLRFRIESPFRSSLYALCTRRSRIALASVGSPMTSCHLRLPPISRTG